jgi:hypothetical protein
VRRCVTGGLADELRIHLAPIVLRGGTRCSARATVAS